MLYFGSFFFFQLSKTFCLNLDNDNQFLHVKKRDFIHVVVDHLFCIDLEGC